MQTATAVLTATRTCANAACIQATTHVELCECGDCLGDNHGSAHRVGVRAAQARMTARTVGGFTSSMLAEIDDEEW